MAALMVLAMPVFFVLGFVYDNTDWWIGVTGASLVAGVFVVIGSWFSPASYASA